MKSIVFVLLVFCILGLSSALDGPTDYFKDSDKADYKKLLSSSKSYLGLRNTYYTVSALKKLGQEIPDKNKVCESAKAASSDAADIFYSVAIQEIPDKNKVCESAKAASSDAADIFYSVAIQDIAGCTFVVNEKLQEDLKKFLTSDTFNNLYYGLSASVLLHKNKQLKGFEKEIKEGTKKLIKLGEEDGTFKTTLKSEEGTVLNGGLALLVLSQVADIVDSKTDLETVLTNAQDVFTSFSEETDDTLQIVDAGSKASNLRVTSTVFKGYVALAAALNEKPLSPDHEKIVAIAQYFVNQKQAQTTEDAYFVLEGLEAVANNNFAVPVVVSLEKSYIDPSTKEGTIKINVVNVLGKEVNSKVTINKINNGNDNKVIKSNVETDNGKFDFVTLKPEAGYYLFDINAKPSDAKYIPVTTTRKVKVIASISVSETAIIVADTIDTQEDGKKVTVDFGKTTDISVQQNQVLVVNFKVQANSKTIQVQQAFLRISNDKYESIHVGRFNGKHYSVGIKVNDLFDQFYGKSGKFDLQLIVGDSFVANPIQWKLSTATIKFDNKTKVEVPVNQFAALPEIKHAFRPADKRADAALSFAFTIAVLAPALLLFVGFIRVGANFSNFPTSGINWIYALGFHGTLGAIFALYALYWLSLTMITTLQYLALLAVPYLFFASKTLNYLAGSANKSHRD